MLNQLCIWSRRPAGQAPVALSRSCRGLAGFVGGVVLATIKSGLGAEDQWTEERVQLSRGVLQRLDALAFAAPVFFHLTLYFFS